jgi:hypothetical protein
MMVAARGGAGFRICAYCTLGCRRFPHREICIPVYENAMLHRIIELFIAENIVPYGEIKNISD